MRISLAKLRNLTFASFSSQFAFYMGCEFCHLFPARRDIHGKSYTKKEALLKIKAGSGSIYDPEVFKAFEEVISGVTA